jgi:hypothetical protein
MALVRTDVSEERTASIIRVTRISQLMFLRSLLQVLIITDVPSSLVVSTLMMEAILPLQFRFLQEQHGVTS